ncbi:MAG: stage sporulation protein [Clostridia bacterium]|nr:stage sporulation protein [Clostridia bacterium]
MFNRGKIIFVGLVAIFLASALAGCPAPAKRPVVGKEPTISLYVKETGQTKRIKIEDYLQGVVAAEMDTSWPVNALAAQAILARTFTMKKIQQGGVKAHGTDASTDVEEFQAYAPEKINANVKRAVDLTRGKVVKYQGNYINGWFHASGGPRTAASAVEGLDYHKEKAPYIQSVMDPGWDRTTPENKSWSATFSPQEIAAAARKISGQDPGPINSIAIVEKGPSGRAYRLKIGRVTVSGPALRLALGNERLRSTLLTDIVVSDRGIIFRGQGYGHGVGMSQWGAKALAEKGKSPEEIIKYFFKGVTIEKAW